MPDANLPFVFKMLLIGQTRSEKILANIPLLERRAELFGGEKTGRFCTSNNIATSAFNSLINRTKMFLVSYCNLSNN